MKSSRIICCCKATLQGPLIGDTAVSGSGQADMGVQQSVTPFYPEGSIHRGVRWEWQQWWCHQNGPWHDGLENDARLGGNCRFSKQWSIATPLQAVHNFQRCRERTFLSKKEKKVYGFTINNETQMVFYTSWLATQGNFLFFLLHSIGFFPHWILILKKQRPLFKNKSTGNN